MGYRWKSVSFLGFVVYLSIVAIYLNKYDINRVIYVRHVGVKRTGMRHTMTMLVQDTSPSVKPNNTHVTQTQYPSTLAPPKVSYIREKLLGHLSPSQVIRVFKPNVTPEQYKFEVNESDLQNDTTSEGLPVQTTCAVVGNSGILTDSACGEAIDRHDYVIRMNLAPFGSKFGRDVGTKSNMTTLNFAQLKLLGYCVRKFEPLKRRSCRDEILRLHSASSRDVIIWYPKGTDRGRDMVGVALWMNKHFNAKTRWAYNPMSLYEKLPDIWDIPKPSTGLIVLSAAALFCREVTVFGFYPHYVDSLNRTLKYHFYDKIPLNFTKNLHDMPREFELIQALESQGALTIQQTACG